MVSIEGNRPTEREKQIPLRETLWLGEGSFCRVTEIPVMPGSQVPYALVVMADLNTMNLIEIFCAESRINRDLVNGYTSQIKHGNGQDIDTIKRNLFSKLDSMPILSRVLPS